MHVEVVENSRERLHLALRASLPLYAGFGLLFIVLGLCCTWLLAVETRIEVEQRRLLYAKTCLLVFDCDRVGVPVTDVRRVEQVGHEVHLETRDGVHALALPQSNDDEKAALARELQAALAHPAGSFRHVEGSPVAGLALGLACVVAGLFILLALQQVSMVADRAAGAVHLTRRLLLWPVARRQEIALAGLEAAVVPYTLNTGRHVVTSYFVRLQSRGQRVDDAVSLTFLPMFTEAAATNVADIIRRWMRGR
jgi:hypothetical protein